MRRVAAAVREADPTRPLIENDWVEPDPERVFTTPVLTAHWYGRPHTAWLEELEAKARRWAGLGRPLFVTELGDWGLPELAEADGERPFWSPAGWYAEAIAALPWPGSAAELIAGTQRHQGLSDRLQAEVIRRHDHLGGWCLTELTDVPWELNGLFDLERRPKPPALAELPRASQAVLAMLELYGLAVAAGGRLAAPVQIANDGPPLPEATVQVTLGGGRAVVEAGTLPGWTATAVGTVDLPVPPTPGPHEVALRLLSAGREVATNTYPVRAVTAMPPAAAAPPVGRVPSVGPVPSVGRVPSVGGVPPATPVDSPAHPAIRWATLPHRGTRRGSGTDEPAPGSGEPAPGSGGPGAGVGAFGAGEPTPSAGEPGAGLGELAGGVGEFGPDLLVVGEGRLDEAVGELVRERLAGGGTVVVLAQGPEAVGAYPVAVEMAEVGTAWGSTVFHFTCDQRALPSLPERAVLAGEDASVVPTHLLTRVGGGTWPATTVVGAFKPVPDPLAGPVVGMQPVGPGRLVTCQYRLAEPARRGDPAALAILGDLLGWAAGGAR